MREILMCSLFTCGSQISTDFQGWTFQFLSRIFSHFQISQYSVCNTYRVKCTINLLFSHSIENMANFPLPTTEDKICYRHFLYTMPIEAVGFKFFRNEQWQYYTLKNFLGGLGSKILLFTTTNTHNFWNENVGSQHLLCIL